jgi:hypothetical protein
MTPLGLMTRCFMQSDLILEYKRSAAKERWNLSDLAVFDSDDMVFAVYWGVIGIPLPNLLDPCIFDTI